MKFFILLMKTSRTLKNRPLASYSLNTSSERRAAIPSVWQAEVMST